MRQHFVGTVTDEDLLRLEAVVSGQRVDQRLALRVRVAAQPGVVEVFQACRHRRRRRVGALVGIELDILLIPGLFARRVGIELADQLAPVITHTMFIRLIGGRRRRG